MQRNDEFVEATRELRESRILARVRVSADVVATAARHSRVVSTIDRVVRAFRSLPPSTRLRLVLVTLAVAIAAHVLLGFFVPRPVAPLWLAPRLKSVQR